MSRTELLFPKLCMARAKATCCDLNRKPDQGTTKLDYCLSYYNSKNSYYLYCPRIEIRKASGLGFRIWDTLINHSEEIMKH